MYMSDNGLKSMIGEGNIERVISQYGRAVTVPVGISMWPMLRNRRDHIVIVPVTRPLRNESLISGNVTEVNTLKLSAPMS